MVNLECLNELQSGTIDELKQALNRAHEEIKALKSAHQIEAEQREKVERELRTYQRQLQLVMDTLPEGVFWKDRNSVFLGCNQKVAQSAGLRSPEDIVGKTDYDLPWTKEESDFFLECDRRVMMSGQAELGIVEPQLQVDGRTIWLETNKAPLKDDQGKIIGILGTYQDITPRKEAEIALQELNQKLERQAVELTKTLEQLKQSQLQLVQSEKMSALGNLMSGIAHEINNPLGFLSGNLQPIQDYIEELFELIELYEKKVPNPDEELVEKIEMIDLAYVQDDLFKTVASMREGIDRIRNISISLRTFSRADTESRVPFKIHEGIESTLMILKHRLKANESRPTIQVMTDYNESIILNCFPGQLNQVFMNFLANAIDALEESNTGKSFKEVQINPGCIWVATSISEDKSSVIIRIRDNGIGMTEATKQRIFENLFTTKAVGKGTGLGLAISHQIVVEKHQGTITVNSELGSGTEFVIQIPIQETSVTLD